jgi:hypothetical protein
MAKLHEVLAVDKDLEKVASEIINEAVVTFSKKTDHFTGHARTLRMFDENRMDEEAGQAEVKEITTTVPAKLKYVAEHVVRYYNALAQKEATNQLAKADVIMSDGTVLLKDVPATLLLSLENKLTRLREMYNFIPTLQPGVEWKPDTDASLRGVYKAAKDKVSLKSEKDFNFRILVAATDKHPAQIEKWNVDKSVGEYTYKQVSGMMTPKQKSDILGRLDDLTAAIKQARSRANTQEVQVFDVGGAIFSYLHKDL